MEAAVISHDEAVGDIESKTELIVEHVGKGNRELDGGIDAARSRNRKKKYCLVALGEFFPFFPSFSLLFPPFHFFLFFQHQAQHQANEFCFLLIDSYPGSYHRRDYRYHIADCFEKMICKKKEEKKERSLVPILNTFTYNPFPYFSLFGGGRGGQGGTRDAGFWS